MIRAYDIVNLLRAEPFKAFTIAMSSGERVRVEHPDQVLVFTHKLIVGLQPKSDQPHVFTRDVHCSMLRIASLEEDHQDAA